MAVTSEAKAQLFANRNVAAKAATHKTILFFLGVVLLLPFCLPMVASAADEQLLYRVSYNLAAPAIVHVSMNVPVATDAPLTLIVPRSVPGGYAQRPYDPFVTNVEAYSAGDTSVEVRREQLGPRWSIGKRGERARTQVFSADFIARKTLAFEQHDADAGAA